MIYIYIEKNNFILSNYEFRKYDDQMKEKEGAITDRVQ